MKDNIILIGFMGCGKSTVGKVLAKKMRYIFLDTDQTIESRQHMPISKIFEKKGEEYFRKLETDTVREMVETTNKSIISTGGGLPLREENSQILKNLGFVVYLNVKKETVLKRLKGDTKRPLLAGGNVEEKVEQMISYRDPIYQVGAHMEIHTDDMSVDKVAEEIIRNYEIMQRKGPCFEKDKEGINL